MCPDNDGLRWLVKTVARGQLRRGGSLPAWPGGAGVPCGGISRHPPERRRATLFRKPQAPRDAPMPPTSSPRAGGSHGTARLAFPAPAPRLLSKRVPGERNLGTLKCAGRAGGWRRLRVSSILMDQAHPRGARAAPRSPPAAEGQHLRAGRAAQGGCHPRAGPAAIAEGPWAPSAPHPPGCGKLSKRADGAGERQQQGGEQKRLFSHATYFTSRTFCAFQPCL